MVLGFTALLALGKANAGEAGGPAVLTVTGKVAETNRPAFDEFEDTFFKYHQRTFESAFAFDIVQLERLGMHKATITYARWPRPVMVEGPFLRDVLAAAEADAGTVRITALDGFTTELTAEDLAAQDWIVAIKADGRYLGIGGRGPSWVVYTRRDGKPATEDDEAHWPWAAFLIEIR
jgi:hypothetical protein